MSGTPGHPHRVRNIVVAALIGFAVVLPLVWLGIEDWRPFGSSDPETVQPIPTETSVRQTETGSSTTAATTTTRSTTGSSKLSAAADNTAVVGGTGPTRYYLADLDYVEVALEGRPAGCTGGCTGSAVDQRRSGPRLTHKASSPGWTETAVGVSRHGTHCDHVIRLRYPSA
jgi:hypothetical protein